MRFGVYLPPQAKSGRVPILYWLSGLTCTEENFIVKAGAQRIAAALGLAIVVPDTSPRGLGIPGEGEQDPVQVDRKPNHVSALYRNHRLRAIPEHSEGYLKT